MASTVDIKEIFTGFFFSSICAFKDENILSTLLEMLDNCKQHDDLRDDAEANGEYIIL